MCPEQTVTFVSPRRPMALMFDGWQKVGAVPIPGAIERLTAMLGRPLRTYRAFAEETAAQWRREATATA